MLCAKGLTRLWSQLVSKVARFPPHAYNDELIIRAHIRRVVGLLYF